MGRGLKLTRKVREGIRLSNHNSCIELIVNSISKNRTSARIRTRHNKAEEDISISFLEPYRPEKNIEIGIEKINNQREIKFYIDAPKEYTINRISQ